MRSSRFVRAYNATVVIRFHREPARVRGIALDPLDPARLVAMVFRHEFLTRGQVPSDEHDRPVDGVVTPDGFTWFGAEPS